MTRFTVSWRAFAALATLWAAADACATSGSSEEARQPARPATKASPPGVSGEPDEFASEPDVDGSSLGGSFSQAASDGGAGDGNGGAGRRAANGERPPRDPGSTVPTCPEDGLGAFCGAHLSPKGDVNTRYFCESSGLVAQVVCPGVCDAGSNTCRQSSGTGTGQGDSVRPLDKCEQCFARPCQDQQLACEADDRCFAHFECVTGCDPSQGCEDNCELAFPDEPLLGALRECLDANGCAALCARGLLSASRLL